MLVQSEVRISLAAVVHNYQLFRGRFGEGRTLVPVVKSDAYGHGGGETALALAAAGADRLAVFDLREARAVRSAGYRGALWLLEGVLPGDAAEAAGLDLTLACWDRESLRALNAQGAAGRSAFRIHLKMDTGMSRLGFLREELPGVLAEIRGMPGIRLTGAFSHLACAAEPDHPVTRFQLEEFRRIREMLPGSCRELHLCATDGLLSGLAPELPFARLGIGLYGYAAGRCPGLRPAMTLASRIISLKTVPAGRCVSYGARYRTPAPGARLAVVPVGYADGYPRRLGGRAEVLVRGRRCPVRGSVCMGMLMADVGGVEDAAPGDEVVLLGRQGGERITAEELAEAAGTISYEILCGLGRSPSRRFE